MMKMKNICILTTLRRSQLMQNIRKTKTNLINSQTMKKSSSINPIDKIVLKLVQTIVNICSSFLNITAEWAMPLAMIQPSNKFNKKHKSWLSINSWYFARNLALLSFPIWVEMAWLKCSRKMHNILKKWTLNNLWRFCVRLPQSFLEMKKM